MIEHEDLGGTVRYNTLDRLVLDSSDSRDHDIRMTLL